MIKRVCYLCICLCCGSCTTTQQITSPSSPPILPSKTPVVMNAFLADLSTPQYQSNFKPLSPSTTLNKKNRIIHVALLAPLSGPFRQIGQQMLQGASAALFSYKDPQIHLMSFDTQGTPDGAQIAIQQAINQKADVCLGPLLATSTEAIADIALEKNISIISLSNSTNITKKNIFIAGITLDEQASNLMQFIKKHVYNIVVMAPENLYGRSAAQAIQKAAIENDIRIQKIIFFDPHAYNFSIPIKSISNYEHRHQAALKAKLLFRRDTLGQLPYQGIVIATTNQTTLQLIASQLAYYDTGEPFVTLYGLQSWNYFSNLSLEPSLIGAQFVTSSPIQNESFQTNYQTLYQKKPQEQAVLAYDLMSMIITIAQHSSKQESNIFAPEQLISIQQGFHGIGGIFRFLPNRQVERKFSISQITQNGDKIIYRSDDCFLCSK